MNPVLSLHAALQHLSSGPWRRRAARLALLGVLGVASGCCSVAGQRSSAHFLRALREGNLAAVQTLCQTEPKLAETLFLVDGLLRYQLSKDSFQEPGRELDDARTVAWLPVYIASWYGHGDVVAFLWDQKGAVELYSAAYTDNSLGTPLQWEILRGRRDLVAKFIRFGIFVNVTACGETPLAVAVCAEDTITAKMLLQAHADVEKGHAVIPASPLQLAAGRGNLDMVRLLVEAGADPNRSPPSPSRQPEETVLAWAARSGHVAVVEYLLDHGARRSHDAAVLLNAVGSGNADVLRLLYNRGFAATDFSQVGAPVVVAIRHGYLEMLNLLLAHGARPTGRWDGYGWYGAGISAKTTALTDAFMRFRISSAERNVYPDDDLAMADAIQRDQRDWVQCLLLAGLDPNGGAPGQLPGLPQAPAKMPLHLAVAHDRYEIAELLLKHGASLEAKDADGLTPVALAEKLGRAKILKLLREAEAARKQGAIEKPAPAPTPDAHPK